MLNQEVLKLIGNELKNRRIKKHISTRDLSLYSGVSKSTVSRIELGNDCGFEKFQTMCYTLRLDWVEVVKNALIEYQMKNKDGNNQKLIQSAECYNQKYDELIELYDSLTSEQQKSVLALIQSIVK